MKRIASVFVVLAGFGAASLVHASGYISRGYAPEPAPGQPTADFQGPVRDGSVRYAYGEVLEVQPVYRSIREPARGQVCYDEPVEYYQAARPPSPVGTLFGAILGGVIGNQLGRGGHGYYRDYRRDSATVVGAAIGGAIGYQASSGPTRVARGYQQRCRVETTWRQAEEVAGYEVTYRYRGEIYQTRTDRHPGDSIPVRVAVEPAY